MSLITCIFLWCCAVSEPVDHSGSSSPLMSKRAQPATACKSTKFVSSSDTGLGSDTGSW